MLKELSGVLRGLILGRGRSYTTVEAGRDKNPKPRVTFPKGICCAQIWPVFTFGFFNCSKSQCSKSDSLTRALTPFAKPLAREFPGCLCTDPPVVTPFPILCTRGYIPCRNTVFWNGLLSVPFYGWKHTGCWNALACREKGKLTIIQHRAWGEALFSSPLSVLLSLISGKLFNSPGYETSWPAGGHGACTLLRSTYEHSNTATEFGGLRVVAGSWSPWRLSTCSVRFGCFHLG